MLLLLHLQSRSRRRRRRRSRTHLVVFNRVGEEDKRSKKPKFNDPIRFFCSQTKPSLIAQFINFFFKCEFIDRILFFSLSLEISAILRPRHLLLDDAAAAAGRFYFFFFSIASSPPNTPHHHQSTNQSLGRASACLFMKRRVL